MITEQYKKAHNKLLDLYEFIDEEGRNMLKLYVAPINLQKRKDFMYNLLLCNMDLENAIQLANTNHFDVYGCYFKNGDWDFLVWYADNELDS